MDLKAIGRRIQEARENKQLSQLALANLVGRKSDETLRLWEAGKVAPPLSIMGRLAAAVGETEEFLLFRIRRDKQLHEERRFLDYVNDSEHELLTAFRQCDKKLHNAIIDGAKAMAVSNPAPDAVIATMNVRKRKK